MKKRKILKEFSILAVFMFVSFFPSCMPGNPSEEAYSGEIKISGTLIAAGPGSSPLNPEPERAAAGDKLAGYQLYCVTATEPVVQGSGVADDLGNVTVILKIRNASFACSILDPQGNRVAKLMFLDPSGTKHGLNISGSGDINLKEIAVNQATGYANATIPSNATIVSIWTATTTANAPNGRLYYTAVWTGAEMIVWGGQTGTSTYTNTGARYNPSTDSWTATTTTNVPSARGSHTAVWTETEMIVWGGSYEDIAWWYLNTGGRYDPATDSWTATTTNNAPSARTGHTAVWTGSKMIVWGGDDNTGGRYDPATDSWTATSTTNAPDRRGGQTGVWTGTEMIVWGGSGISPYKNDGGRYNPATDSWTATSITNAPSARSNPASVWTGTEMIVWGGEIDMGVTYTNTGGRYDPAIDSWAATTTTNAPSARQAYTLVWTGTEMIVWGGFYWGTRYVLNTGGRYDPETDAWTETTTTNAPSERYWHTAVWTGSEMIVWGGAERDYLITGGRYVP